ncbi:unnamed protein product [Peronospora belbahrii]|uniref:PDZ domain-containing protein n=1 Tax=Peronospora belbahrii TaxID=622444 RepID=A0ABN8CNH5_9STRA|nr:unnamed protein product [Peronospora belbahrii]
MEIHAIDNISKIFGLPHPFLTEPNQAFTPLETWQQLTALLATQFVKITPLGYYRTLDSIDIYVFECSICCDTSSYRRYCWKLYRRYRHFQKYIEHSSEFVPNRSVRVPRLAQTYFKIFHAQHCKDRLVELYQWLKKVVEITQTYCQQLHQKHEMQEKVKLRALQQQRLAQVGKKAAKQEHTGKSHCNTADGAMSSMSTSRLRPPSKMNLTTSTRRWSSVSMQTIEQRGDPVLCVLKADKEEVLPMVMLSCFLFAGANCPFPHVFRGMPSFALAMEELNVQLTEAVPAAYPSKLNNSQTTRTGLGLRLTPSHEQEGQFLGATVAGFLRDQHELDPALAGVPVGARLVQVNGIDVNVLPFDQVLIQLRSLGLPLRLRFVYNPYLNRQRSSSVTLRNSADATPAAISERQRVTLSAGQRGSGYPAVDSVEIRNSHTDANRRSYSVDAHRSKPGLFGLVFGELFGATSGSEVSTAPSATNGVSAGHGEIADTTFGSDYHLSFNGSGTILFSWDDINGRSRDLILRGFFSYLPQSFMRELRRKRRAEMKAKPMLPEHYTNDSDDSDESDDNQCCEENSANLGHKVQGVWSTATGPIGLSFGACKIRDVEAAMLEASPVFFSFRREHQGSERHLCKGFILISINSESTFGVSFAMTINRLRSASRPTSLCFRWYTDFSPYLETKLVTKNESSNNRSTSLRKAHAIEANAFVNNLDCVAEAQTDLSNSLQLALIENASIRDEIGVLQDAHRKLRLAQEYSAQRERCLQANIEQSDVLVARLKDDIKVQRQQLEKLRLRAQEAESELAMNRKEYEIMLKEAQECAKARLAEHEKDLVKESNRSINDAKHRAEDHAKKMLEMAAIESQRKHDEYLQKLAEEHSDEVESLMQQVAVWRHQVEVLTEAEKRNYAALVSNGVNPYTRYCHRSRFGYTSTDLPDADWRLRDKKNDRQRIEGSTMTTCCASSTTKWHDSSNPLDKITMDKGHAFSRSSDQLIQSKNSTFWDRMVSLLATE